MKKVIFFCAAIIVTAFSYAQQNTVTVIASGDGKTKDESLNAALRHCIEKTFGVFVSTNSTISNDSLVKDEIATVASGNIASYKELSDTFISNTYTTKVSAEVSPENIVKIMKSKGYSFEIKGSVFAHNIMKDQFYK